MSHIQYKFSSSKDYSTTIFDGLSISVIDLKQEILREQKLDPEEFSLVITNEQTNEDYGSDQTLIPKNTSVVVRRVPYTGPKMSRMANGGHSQQSNAGYVAPPFGSGGGSSYQRGQMAQSTAPVNQYGYRGPQGGGVNGQHRGNASNQRSEDNARNGHEVPSSVEDAGIAAMFEQSNEQWMHQQSLMEMQRPMYQPRPGGPRPRPAMMRPEHQGPPPPNYICHRCGKPGHWIYSCPSLSQPGDGSGKPTGFRVKRTTGIPKSFLQKVDNIEDVGNALVTSDGTLVVATANEAAWNMAQKMSRNAVSTEDEIDPNIIPNSIKCNICHKISRDAVTTPCCKTVFCSTCIECELLEPGDMNFTCPACHTKDVVPDQLETAGEVRSQVEEFLREYSAKQHAALEESDRAARKAAAAASAPAVAASAVGGANGVPASAPSAAATSASTSIARPPAQVPPRPRQQHMGGMLPGMLMGLGGGYPGMAGMPMGMQMGMGQMPPFMPPGMMMPPGIMPPAGMMPSRPPPLPGMAAAGQWDGGSAALPMGGAMAGWPAAVGPQHQTRPIGGPQTSQAPSPSPSRPRSRSSVSSHRQARSHSRSRSPGRRRSPRPPHGTKPKYRQSSVENRDGEKPNASVSAEYEAPPLAGDSGSRAGEDRRRARADSRSRDDSRSRRDRRRPDNEGSSGRHGGSDRYRSRERDREHRRDRDSHREGRGGDSRSGAHSRRGGRSRSPARARRTSRDRGGSSSHRASEENSSSRSRHVSIRGQSSVLTSEQAAASEKPRSVLDRLGGDRSAAYNDNDDEHLERKSGGGRQGRRRRRR
ncbi:Retinoblastoma-binding protein [Coemansia sp. RSA 2322]|uniref:Retinoblastoma-binding protein n=1 Tax=Coemansia thaxteri TaxID=2663907 RepID=A0A9W8BMQ6_9FUNG|nr:Retinoblastoma-binding protein [Coemansia thaxteri]KAJ2469819.1 Retinoblastoma-binding protein [Coemansia sp. RSA 2322]KAJ2487514.1 Retinoblastoma-binding protein [Coemansia sp. RSA 2320]